MYICTTTSSSRFSRKKAVIAMQISHQCVWSWLFCANILALRSGWVSAFTSYSHSRSHHFLVNERYHTRVGRIRNSWPTSTPRTVAVAAEEASIVKALKSRNDQIKRRKHCALFMSNENFPNEQLNVDMKVEIDTNTDAGNITAYDKNDNDENRLPGSKQLTNFFSLPIVDVAQGLLVLLSSLLVAVGTLQTLPEQACKGILNTEDLIGEIFFFDFLLRWYSNGFKREYLFNPFSIIDAVFILPVILNGMPSLAAMLPSALSSSSGLINLRLLRILRLQLVLSDLETFGKFEMALGLRPSDVRPYQLQLARVILSVFTLISVSTGLIYTSEHTANPTGFPDYFTALYFGLTTLTTVGFGDITPITFNGRLVVSGSILAGVAVIPIQAAALFEALLDFQKERQQNLDNENERIVLEQNVTDPPHRFNDDNIIGLNTTASNNGNHHSGEQFIDCLCKTCNASPHRRDAFFCWQCGTELTSSVGNVAVDAK